MPTLLINKRATFDYELLQKYDAGLDLFGFEVKSLRAKHGSLKGSYVTVRNNNAYLQNAFIPPFQEANAPKNYDPYRTRSLLLTKKELQILMHENKTHGLTLVPISVYNKGRFLKLSFAVARGKKKFDKRESLKKRDTERDIHRTLKNQ